MRHKRLTNHFKRRSGPRKALVRGLVHSLVQHERIETTVEKAKELRRHVERAVTIGKKADMNAARLLLSRFPRKDTVSKLIRDLGPRFKDRAGGYTRIIKLGARKGDGAEMAFIEFVDFDPTKERVSQEVSEKELARRNAKQKKRLRKLQTADRRILRDRMKR